MVWIALMLSTNIFKNTTTLLSLRNMFLCFKHHLQPYSVLSVTLKFFQDNLYVYI